MVVLYVFFIFQIFGVCLLIYFVLIIVRLFGIRFKGVEKVIVYLVFVFQVFIVKFSGGAEMEMSYVDYVVFIVQDSYESICNQENIQYIGYNFLYIEY